MKQKEIMIAGRPIGLEHPPYMIAELSANHHGSFDRAVALIDAAQAAGADAIKLQTYTADTMTIQSDFADFQIVDGLWKGHTLHDLYRLAQTPYNWHKELFGYAKKVGITLFSTPFDESAVDLLEELDVPAYKVASFEIVDIPLLGYIAKTGKPIILSTGMADEHEIFEAIKAIHEAGNDQLILLHCISGYPVPIEQSHLRQIVELQNLFQLPVGLSDHTLGMTAAIASVGLNACVIEKHFTLDRSDAGPDSEFSLEPSEFADLSREVKFAWSALGKPGFYRTEAEASSRQFRRSIYFVRDLPAGAIIQAQDIRRIRPGFGLPPKFFDQIVGRKLKSPVQSGTPVKWDLLEH